MTTQTIEVSPTGIKKGFLPELSWEVKEEAILRDGKKTGWKHLINTSIEDPVEQILDTVKDSWKPIHNEKFMEVAEQLCHSSGFKLVGYQDFQNGKKVMAYLESDAQTIEESDVYMVIGNSHIHGFSAFTGAVQRIYRCENMFSTRNRQYKIPHTKEANIRFDSLQKRIEYFYKDVEQYNRFCEQAGNFDIVWNKHTLMPYMAEVLGIHYNPSSEEFTYRSKPLSTKLSNKVNAFKESLITEGKQLGKNAYALHQGCTYFTTHKFSQAKVQNTFGNMFNSANEMNQRSLSYLKKMIQFQDN